jgi:uncharacterized protein YsxB (DUF464 family)
MIRSIIWRDKQGQIRRFSVKGHAYAADPGEDVVCAAVSMLVLNGINAPERLLGVVLATEDDVSPGDVQIEVPVLADQTADDNLQLLLEAMVFGLEQTAEIYPEFVKFTVNNL